MGQCAGMSLDGSASCAGRGRPRACISFRGVFSLPADGLQDSCHRRRAAPCLLLGGRDRCGLVEPELLTQPRLHQCAGVGRGRAAVARDACARLCWLCIRADVGPCQAVLTHSRYCATHCRYWVHHRLVCADEMHRRRCVLRSGRPAEHRSREHARVHSRRRGVRFDVTPRRRDDRIWNRVASRRTASRWHRLTPGRRGDSRHVRSRLRGLARHGAAHLGCSHDAVDPRRCRLVDPTSNRYVVALSGDLDSPRKARAACLECAGMSLE